MNPLFQCASAQWVRYSAYEFCKAQDGKQYLTPAKNAKPEVYDPITTADDMVLDALNAGLLCMNHADEEVIRTAVISFVSHYGLLGLMTALPTTPTFMDYEAVYLPTNRFIREEHMETDAYLSLFFPFEKPTLAKRGMESIGSISDKTAIALAIAFRNSPLAVQMSFGREYAERYDWIVAQLKDWAFAFVSSFLYYQDYDMLGEAERDLYRKGMAAYDGIAPSYHVELRDKPTVVWDFHSLLLTIHILFTQLLTDDKAPLKLCKRCQKVFMAKRADAAFCSMRCKNQYNVYKNRAKNE